MASGCPASRDERGEQCERREHDGEAQRRQASLTQACLVAAKYGPGIEGDRPAHALADRDLDQHAFHAAHCLGSLLHGGHKTAPVRFLFAGTVGLMRCDDPSRCIIDQSHRAGAPKPRWMDQGAQFALFDEGQGNARTARAIIKPARHGHMAWQA